jgi:integration host factor subunit beta
MTKTELIKKMADDCSLTLKDAETAVNVFIDCITQALAEGDKVELRGFGSFRTKHREARRGRNPKTGATVDVDPKTVPFFKPGKEFRALIDPQPEPVLVVQSAKAAARPRRRA